METLKSNHHSFASVFSSKIKSNSVQKLYTKIMNKTEDSPPKKGCSLVRSSPVNKNLGYLKKPTGSQSCSQGLKKKVEETAILSDEEDFCSKLTFNDFERSLEDEIFEELEKVAHDEVKLNAAIQNFDRILLEYNDTQKAKAVNPNCEEKRSSAIPKPLQKSKTCSIIESQCILKKQNDKAKLTSTKPTRNSPESFNHVSSLNQHCGAKSLWNLQDFDGLSKNKSHTKLGPRKSESSVMPAKSVCDLTATSRPSYSRQSSISKIPIKSSKLSLSMMQLNASNSTLNLESNSSSPQSMNTRMYASTMSLTSHSASRRSSTSVIGKIGSPSPIAKYSETKASIQRRNMITSKILTNQKTVSIAQSKTNTAMKRAKSEIAIHGKNQMPSCKQKIGTNHPNHHVDKSIVRCSNASLAVKGQNYLRKDEKFSDHDKAKVSLSDVRKRDYIAKCQKVASPVITNNELGLTNKFTKTTETKSNANDDITRHLMTNESGNDSLLSQSSPKKTTVKTRVSEFEITPSSPATLELCGKRIPIVLDSTRIIKADDKSVKGYNSDCSDDSGHISNENEDLTMKLKPKKISGELLEIFEKKQTQEKLLSPPIDIENVNIVKTSIEIYPNLNKTCKSEVKFYINVY